MILIQCDKCADTFSITQEAKVCKCGSCMAATTGNDLISFTGNPIILEINDADLKLCKRISSRIDESTEIPCVFINHTDPRLIKLSNKVNEAVA